MKKKFKTQIILLCLFIFIFGSIGQSISELQYIHELGHLLYAKSSGWDAEIINYKTTRIKNANTDWKLYLAGPVFIIYVYAFLAFLLLLVLSHKNISIAGVPIGLFLSEIMFKLEYNYKIDNVCDFYIILNRFNIDPIINYKFFVFIFTLLISITMFIKLLHISKNIKNYELFTQNYNKLYRCDNS